MSNMTIDVEFLAGTDIEEAIIEAKEKANNLDLAYVCFSFNGARMSIGRHVNIDDAVADFRDSLKTKAFVCHR